MYPSMVGDVVTRIILGRVRVKFKAKVGAAGCPVP